jgi:hypothetical protein
MFIEINGHLVNEHGIVAVSPEGYVTLASGAGFHCKDDAEQLALRDHLLGMNVPTVWSDLSRLPTPEEVKQKLDDFYISGGKDSEPYTGKELDAEVAKLSPEELAAHQQRLADAQKQWAESESAIESKDAIPPHGT